MVSALVLATLLTFTDPAGDAFGDGSLTYPSAEIFRAPGTMDVRELNVYDENLFSFSVSLAQVTNPLELPHGFSLPIIEVYVNTREPGGRSELLPGSGMRLPDGVVWNYVFRITGESLELLYVDPESGALVDMTEAYRVTLVLEDTTLFISTDLPRPRHFSLYGVVGGYDFWDPTRWRRVRPQAEAFAFGSPSQATNDIRAVDVLAPGQEAQLLAIQTGVLPEIRSPNQQGRWLILMAGGLVVALLGSAGRVYAGYRARPRLRPTIGYGSYPPDADADLKDEADPDDADFGDPGFEPDPAEPELLEAGSLEADSREGAPLETEPAEAEPAETELPEAEHVGSESGEVKPLAPATARPELPENLAEHPPEAPQSEAPGATAASRGDAQIAGETESAPAAPTAPALPASRPRLERPPKQVSLEEVDSWDIWLEEDGEEDALPGFERERFPLKATKRP